MPNSHNPEKNQAVARCTKCGLTFAWLPEKVNGKPFDMIDRWGNCGGRIIYVG